MFNDVDALFIGICLEGFFYGKISVLCVVSLLEVQLFLQDSIPEYSPFIYNAHQKSPGRQPSFSMHSVFSTFCLLLQLSVMQQTSYFIWKILSANQVRIYIFSCTVAFRDTIAPTSNWLTISNNSLFDWPNYSNRSLWLHRPMYNSKYKPLYLSIVLFT
jgi:hypothetical protein